MNLELSKESSTALISNIAKSTKAFLVYLMNIHPQYLSKQLVLQGRPFSKRVDNKKGIYTDEEIAKIEWALNRYDKNDWFVDVTTMTMLTGKRIGEILNIEKDCIEKIDKYYYLKYVDSKSGKASTLPLSSDEHSLKKDNIFKTNIYDVIKDIVDRRIKNMPKSELFGITKESDRSKLFLIEHSNPNRYGEKIRCVDAELLSSVKNSFLVSNGITEIGLDYSKFRNTIASRIIRSGYGEEAASRVLGNLIKTVRYYYEGNVTKKETLDLEIDAAIDLEVDIESIQKMNKVPTYRENCQTLFAVPGGFCEGGSETASSCKFYNRLFANGGCLGCPTLSVTSENMFYYDDLHERLIDELKNEKNTPFKTSVEDKIELIKSVIEIIEEGSNNDKW